MASPVQVPPPRQRRSFAGPLVLIVVGTCLLLANMGVLQWHHLGLWFARFWPLLIILWGIVKLIEYQQAQKEGVRPRGIGAGGVFLLIVLIVFGMAASQAARFNWKALQDEAGIDDNNFVWFGRTTTTTTSCSKPSLPTRICISSLSAAQSTSMPRPTTRSMSASTNASPPKTSPTPTNGTPAPSPRSASAARP